MTTSQDKSFRAQHSDKPPKPLGKACRRINNRLNQIHGLVEPSQTCSSDRRQSSLGEDLHREVMALRRDSANAQRQSLTTPSSHNQVILSRDDQEPRSASQSIQAKTSKKDSRRKTALVSSQRAKLREARHRQKAYDQCLNFRQTICLDGKASRPGHQEAMMTQDLDHDNGTAARSPLPEVYPSSERTMGSSSLLSRVVAEQKTPPVTYTAGTIGTWKSPEAERYCNDASKDDVPPVLSDQQIRERTVFSPPVDVSETPHIHGGSVVSHSWPSLKRPQLRLEIPTISTVQRNSSPDSGYSSASDIQYTLGCDLRGLRWAYSLPGGYSKLLDDRGVWNWQKPLTYYLPFSGMNARRLRTTPVIVPDKNTGCDAPRLEFDGTSICITPHAIPWEDRRSDISHPDFLDTRKLTEYQACEVFGYRVWRHDRDLLQCRKLSCNAKVSDYDASTIVCSGCGPKSLVRYCSFQHQVDDITKHWQECGHPNLIITNVIDHTSEPAHFTEICRYIQERHGTRSFVLHRQRLFASLTYGLYTLFYTRSGDSKTLLWPKRDVPCIEMNDRMERLLNIAFFDCEQRVVIDYLYRLLRECLHKSGEWDYYNGRTLTAQFISEFGRALFDPYTTTNCGYCECEWSGSLVSSAKHSSTCPIVQVKDKEYPREGVKSLVETLEARYWILRAWRQQHPSLRDWRSRAAGGSHRGSHRERNIFNLGPGWTGWGGTQDNLCDDQFERTNRS